MQISGPTFLPNAGPTNWSAAASDRKAVGETSAYVSAQPQAEQDKVTISDAARRAQLQEQDTAQVPAASEAVAGPAVADPEVAADEDANPTDSSGAAKGFLYGALGLERPEKETENIPPDGYTAGRWLSAAVTVGALVSILV